MLAAATAIVVGGAVLAAATAVVVAGTELATATAVVVVGAVVATGACVVVVVSYVDEVVGWVTVVLVATVEPVWAALAVSTADARSGAGGAADRSRNHQPMAATATTPITTRASRRLSTLRP